MGSRKISFYCCYFKFEGTDGLNEVTVIFLMILTSHLRYPKFKNDNLLFLRCDTCFGDSINADQIL